MPQNPPLAEKDYGVVNNPAPTPGPTLHQLLLGVLAAFERAAAKADKEGVVFQIQRDGSTGKYIAVVTKQEIIRP